MQVEYRPMIEPEVLRLDNLTDEELSEALKTHVIGRISDVSHAEIWRNDTPNRHERRKRARMERREGKN